MGNYSVIKEFCTSNGPGVRTSIYLSGCNIHCKGCFNYDAWDFASGEPVTEEVINQLIKSIEPEFIQGISILGGEPLDVKNQATTLEIVKAVKKAYGDKKDIWIWTGYEIDRNLPHTPSTKQILRNADVIVDGPFVIEEQDIKLPYMGSRNQRVLHKGVDF